MGVSVMNAKSVYDININGTVYQSKKSTILGEELLAIACVEPANEHVIYLLLEDGDMESIRLSEPVDLQRRGVEKFLTFKTDVIYRLEVDGNPREWGADFISGRAIKRLSDNENSDERGVWHKGKDGNYKLIDDTDLVDLKAKGIEQFKLGAKYSICIEGKVHEWPKRTITTEEIIQLGGWDASQGAVEVDRDQNERALSSGEVITLKPGHNFCKMQRFRRGFDSESRIGQEIFLLQKNYESVEYKEVNNLHWFKINGYFLPTPLAPNQISVVFSVTAGHPVPKPYGFYVPVGIKFGDQILNFNNPQHPPPFDGDWRFISWDIENWRPGVDVCTGDNLWGWARSFRGRLLEGE